MDTAKLKTYIVNHLEEMKGRSGKHIESTMELLKINLKKDYEIEGTINGTANDGWIILDLGNVIVHLFIPPVREIYKLEELFYTKK